MQNLNDHKFYRFRKKKDPLLPKQERQFDHYYNNGISRIIIIIQCYSSPPEKLGIIGQPLSDYDPQTLRYVERSEEEEESECEDGESEMTDDIYEDNASGGLMDVDDIDADIQTISIMLWHIHIQIFVYLDVFITLYYNLWNFIYTNFHKFSVIMTSQSQ